MLQHLQSDAVQHVQSELPVSDSMMPYSTCSLSSLPVCGD